MTTRPDTQSASLNPGSRLRARLGLQVKRMLERRSARWDFETMEMNMIDWITTNKEWLFSGLGIVILTLLGSFGKKIFIQTKNKLSCRQMKNSSSKSIIQSVSIEENTIKDSYLKENSANTSIKESYKKQIIESDVLDITPKEIYDKSKMLSEIEYQEYQQSFVGKTIHWSGSIATAKKEINNETDIRIQVTFYNENLRGFFVVSMLKYPNTRLFRSSDTLEIKGLISDFDGTCLGLKDVKLISWNEKMF